MIHVKKRDGRIVDFDKQRIYNAILAAMKEVDNINTRTATRIANEISKEVNDSVSIETIQDLVEEKLMASSLKDVAKAYIIYRQNRTYARENTIDKTIDEIVLNTNDYWTHENSNKDPKTATTQRDYIAGAVSTDETRRRLLPKDIVQAHDEGIIHFHDADYFIQPIHNCALVNLEDMLQNGTVISKSMIDKPHEFSTACNIATQIIAQVASSQYGGQSISLAHLSPFVEETRKSLRIKFPELSDEMIEKLVEKDIKDGIQTLQYQILTLMTTNGQTPFITIYMNLGEVEDGQGREDLAKCIEEMLEQRILGVKNEVGVYISPTFPKLIYALDDFNAYEGSKYFYLTELSAKCTAKRLVPDYISNKVQRELKQGQTYTCMGCRSFLSPDRTSKNWSRARNYKEGVQKFYGRFNQGRYYAPSLREQGMKTA